MTEKHKRLACAVNDAMLAQGFNMKQVAVFAGCTASNISNALSGKYDMREERWRLVCENLGLDYDEIIKDPKPEEIPVQETASSAENEDSPAEEIRGEQPFSLVRTSRNTKKICPSTMKNAAPWLWQPGTWPAI